MPRSLKTLLALAAAAGITVSSSAFSLLGPPADWQTGRLGYNLNVTTPGGVMDIGEEYRFNVPTVFYGFSPDFLNYFGKRGAEEIDKAFKILNDLPRASRIDIDQYPLTSLRVNHRAAELSLYDIKSVALSTMLNQMGAADPIRFVFTLRSRWETSDPDTTNFWVINRNFDPATWRTTTFINGQLWTYSQVFDVNESESFVNTTPVDPLALAGFVNAPVASGDGSGRLPLGGFWTGLTRDDVGAIRYIYRRDNYNVEAIADNITGTAGGGAWGPPPGSTNAAGTNFVTIGLRPGINKVQFRRVDYNSTLGIFQPFTNTFVDSFITNSQIFSQNVERPLVAPDILFHVADILGGDDADGLVFAEYDQSEWVNNDELSPPAGNLGPGVINPGVDGPALTFTFNSLSWILWNQWPGPLNELGATRIGWLWGSFDGSTNEPVVYPVGIEVRDLERRVLRGDPGTGWLPPPFQFEPPPAGGGGGTGDTGGATGGGGGL